MWGITLFCWMSSSWSNSMTQCNILEELDLQQHHCENLKTEAGSHTEVKEENILALPGIKLQFLICPAHSLITVLMSYCSPGCNPGWQGPGLPITAYWSNLLTFALSFYNRMRLDIHPSQLWGFVYPASCCTNCFQDSYVSVVSMRPLCVGGYRLWNCSPQPPPATRTFFIAACTLFAWRHNWLC